MRTLPALFFCLLSTCFSTPAISAQDILESTETALRNAVSKVSPSVCKIETAGGADIVGGPSVMQGAVRKGVGPTTGLVVSADGYIVTSSFNFANKPTDIFVTIPNKSRMVAKIIATDNTRMVTLLKVDAKDLPVPEEYPVKEATIGHWAVAVGRTLNPDVNGSPSYSIGIISAKDRIQGKALQTDAKISPVNYGGPLVATNGKVYGVLVPLSPRGDTDTAGLEWYDSGIGFAVPLETIMAVLPRMKAGESLSRGVLGVTFKNGQEPYFDHPTVDVITVDSTAQKIGLQTGDKIIGVDDKPIPHISALQFALGPKYSKDKIKLKILRGEKEETFENVELGSSLSAYIQPFLGILPMRDDPNEGVEIRYVFPDSPADKAGLKAGDRIMKVPSPRGLPPGSPELSPVTGRDALSAAMLGLQPNADAKFEVKAKADGKVKKVSVKMSIVTDELPSDTPLPSSVEKALQKPKVQKQSLTKKPVKPEEDDEKEGEEKEKKPQEKKPDEKKPEEKKAEGEKKDGEKKDGEKKDDEKKEMEKGFIERTNKTLGRQYWIYVPTTYKPDVAHGVILWLHDAGNAGKDGKDVAKTWAEYCETNHFILIGPKSQSNTGWVASETEAVINDLSELYKEFTIDRRRVVAHGIGIGGQMAYYLGFNARQHIRGVAASSAALATNPKENVPGEYLSFFIIGGDKDPAINEIRESRPRLVEKRFPVYFRELKDFGKQYLDEKSFAEMQKWLDSLDRI